MKTKIASLLALALIGGLLLSACSGSAEKSPGDVQPSPAGTQSTAPSGNETENVEGKRVTMILKNFANPFFVSMREGAEAAAKECGIEITVLAPLTAESNEEQSSMVDQAIVNQTDLLIMCPSDTNAIIPAIERVYDAGIPIVTLGTRVGGEKVMWKTFVVADNYDAGYQTAIALAEKMGGKGELIILEGVPGATASIDRVEGGLAGFAQYPDIKIVAQQSANFNRAEAMDVTQNLLQAHPNVTGLWAANDEMAMGAAQAIAGAGMSDQMFVSGIDGSDETYEAMREGSVTITCSTEPYNQGYYAVMCARDALLGKELPEVYSCPVQLIDSLEALDAFLAGK